MHTFIHTYILERLNWLAYLSVFLPTILLTYKSVAKKMQTENLPKMVITYWLDYWLTRLQECHFAKNYTQNKNLTRVLDYNANRKIEKKSLAPTSATTATRLNSQVGKSRDISPLLCSGMQTILARLNWLDWIYEWTEWMIELNELIWLNWPSRPICTTRIAETTCRKLAETNCRVNCRNDRNCTTRFPLLTILQCSSISLSISLPPKKNIKIHRNIIFLHTIKTNIWLTRVLQTTQQTARVDKKRQTLYRSNNRHATELRVENRNWG